ncbi:MAG: hypothetical protein KatS3mg103_1118 [Phycisphaerales bacterium]|nr:MAG: hypothetical protein KatS3mg103_1118 [Phycisphaerales bacterium]
MFALDRDLLAIEPHAFTDALWAGRRLSTGQATVSGTTLTASSTSVGFLQAQAAPGQVVVFNAVPLEVIDVTSDSVLEVSRLRASADDPALPPVPASAVPFTLVSFAPQIAIVHRQLMGMLGLDDPQGPGPQAVVDPAPLAHAEALGALHLIYAAAGALSGPSSALGARAAMYADMFGRARRSLAVGLDLDGDGLVDATRRPALVHLVRG